jgi:chromosome segregation ATPase
MKGTLLGAGGAILALFGLQFYGMHSTKVSMESRMDEMQSKIESLQADQNTRMAELTNNVNQQLGATSQDILQQTQKAQTAWKKEQSKTAADLHQVNTQLQQHAKAVDSLREESTAKIEEVRKDANTQIGAVNGDVKAVNGQVDIVKSDLATTKGDLAANRKDLNDVRDSLGRQIAHNEDELSILKRRGERTYFEFNIAKSNTMQRVGDIQVQLIKADAKAQRYDVALLVADTKQAKKNQIANEPVPLLVGQNHIRYELVVNSVEKDRIRGYISAPKDVVLSAEGPTAH